jgi:hypothetical protein
VADAEENQIEHEMTVDGALRAAWESKTPKAVIRALRASAMAVFNGPTALPR